MCVTLLFSDPVVHHKVIPKHDKASILQKPPEFYQLLEKIGPRVKAKWIVLGSVLHMDMHELNAIQKENLAECLPCLMKVLHQWENNADTRAPYTWATIIETLKSELMSEEKLAKEVECWLLKEEK